MAGDKASSPAAKKPAAKDIRGFFAAKPAGGGGGGAAAPGAKAVKAEAVPPSEAAPPPPSKVSPHFGGAGGGGGAGPPAAKPSPASKKAAAGGGAGAGRKPTAKKPAAPPQKKAKKAPAGRARALASSDEDDDEPSSSESEWESGDGSSSSSDDDDMDVSDEGGGGGRAGGARRGKAPAATATRGRAVPMKREPSAGGARRTAAVGAADDDDDGVAIVISDDDEDAAFVPAKRKAGGGGAGPSAAATPAAKRTKAGAGGGAATPAAKPTPRPKKAVTPAPAAMAPGAGAAQAAVAAAVETLPPPVYSLQAEGAGAWGRPEDAPPAAGSAPPPPRAHPDCLGKFCFVISGVLDSLHRDEAADLIRAHGGRVVGAVSGKTDFLVVGANTGRSKFSAAQAKKDKDGQPKVRLIDEAGLRHLLAAAPYSDADAAAAEAAAEEAAAAASAGAAGGRGAAASPPGARLAPPPHPTGGGGGGGGAGPSTAAGPSGGGGGGGLSSLWVDKYRPTSTRDLVGNPGSVSALKAWLADWERVHVHGLPPAHRPAKAGRGGQFEVQYARKAALLTGGPGVGKTSAALAAAAEAGYAAVEVNASDTRNQADKSARAGVGGKLANAIKEMATNAALPGAGGSARRPLLIMDEVDGMSAGDRGGVSDLIDTIKKSRVPIICIANDKHAQKLKSLRNHTLELDFIKPQAVAVAKRLAAVCAAEGLQANEATLRALAEGANCDVRALLGQLQFVRLRKRTLAFADAKDGGRFSVSKDMAMTPFAAARSLFEAEGARRPLADRLDAALADADLVPLLVQENYVNHTPTVAGGDVGARLRLVAKAADFMSEGDVVSRAVRIRQQWTLLPFQALLAAAGPGAIMRGPFQPFGTYPGEPAFPRFAAWFGLNSTATKQRRLLGELAARLNASGKCDADRSAVRADYAPALAAAAVAPLSAPPGSGAAPDPEAAAAVLVDYGLTKDDFDFLLDVTTWKKGGARAGGAAAKAAAAFKALPGPAKAAFTRALTAAAPLPRWNADAPAFTRTKGGRGGRGAALGAKKGGRGRSGSGAGEAEEEEEEGEGEGGEGERSPSKSTSPGADDADADDADLPDEVRAARLAARLAADGVELSAPVAKGKGKAAAGGGGAKGKGKAKAK